MLRISLPKQRSSGFIYMSRSRRLMTSELNSYVSVATSIRQQVVAYMAWALLQSLHYDLCILRIKNESVDLMLGAADRLLSTGSTELR